MQRWDSLDIVVLDYRMPGMNGWDGLVAAKKLRAKLPVVIMSGAPGSTIVRQAIRNGASGFFPKTLTGPALVSALRLVMAGEIFVPASALEDRPASEPTNGTSAPPLTPRERQVLDGLVKGCSNKEIARDLAVEEVTVKLHLRSVFRKLGARNRTQAVMEAVQHGWA